MLVRASRRTTDLSGKCLSSKGENEALDLQDPLTDFCWGILLPFLARSPRQERAPDTSVLIPCGTSPEPTKHVHLNFTV